MRCSLLEPRSDSRRRAVARAQEGSAYLMVLLVMVVLSSIGLSLSFITETESQIGATERTLQRVLYTAEWGMDASASRALAIANYGPADYIVEEDDAAAVLNLRYEVDVSPFFPVLAAPCNLCEINNAGEYGEKNYFQVTHAVSSTASRVGAVDTATAEKSLGSMLDVQPWQVSAESLFMLEQPDELEKIRF